MRTFWASKQTFHAKFEISAGSFQEVESVQLEGSFVIE